MTRTCATCGAVNRIPAKRISEASHCGRCKANLPVADAPIDVPDARSFHEILEGSTIPVLVDFWATWCGPCTASAPEVKKAAATLAGRALVLKVDTDRLWDVAARYRIHSIPSFIVFRGEKAVDHHAGAVKAAEMVRWVDSAPAAA